MENMETLETDSRVTDVSLRLQNLPYFTRLSTSTIERMAQVVVEMQYNSGVPLVNPVPPPKEDGADESNQQQIWNDFFIIEQGIVKKETYNAFDDLVCIRTLGKDQFFGHFSLTYNVPHLTSITVVSPVKALKISGADFQTLLNDCPDLKALFWNRSIRHTAFADRLRYLSFFDTFTESELDKVIKYIEVTHIKAGEDLRSALERDVTLAFISRGRVLVNNERAGKIKNVSMSRGNFISNLTDEAISFEVAEDTTLFTMTREGVEMMVGEVERLQLRSVLNREFVVERLSRVPLFKNFAEADRNSLAWITGQATFGKEQYVCRQGDGGSRYFVVHKGQIELRSLNKDGKKPHDGAKTLTIGSDEAADAPIYTLGEPAIFLGLPISEGIYTKSTIELLFIDRADFAYIRNNNDKVDNDFQPATETVKKYFENLGYKKELLAVTGGEQRQKKREEEEIIYYCRRHWIAFVYGLFKVPGVDRLKYTEEWRGRLPSPEWIVYIMLGLALFAVFLLPPVITEATSFLILITEVLSMTLIGIVAAPIIAWIVWHYADWRNDYLVITTQRVIQKEKIILLYEKQAEVELDKIQTYSTDAGLLGSLLGYYDITVSTAAADKMILFDRAPGPSLIRKNLVKLPFVGRFFEPAEREHAGRVLSQVQEEQKGRGAAVAAQQTKRGLQEMLRGQIEKSHRDVWQSAGKADPPAPKPTFWEKRQKGFSNFLDVVVPWRDLEQKHNPNDPDNPVYVWRKHWSVLLRETWDSTLSFAGFTLVVILYLFGIFSLPDLPIFGLNIVNYLTVIVFLTYFAIGAWFWYEVADWGNDLYVLTKKEIIDIERKPLFVAEKRSQSDIDKVENVEYSQEGIFDNLFNVGDVIITMAGGPPIEFKRVFSPVDVQATLSDLSQKAKDDAAAAAHAAEQKKFTEWLTVYHDTFVNVEQC